MKEAPRTTSMEWTSPMPEGIPPVKVTMTPKRDQEFTELLLDKGSLNYMVGEIVWFDGSTHRVFAFEPEKRLVLRKIRRPSDRS